MSANLKYRNGVKHWLILEFGWGVEEAKEYIDGNKDYVMQLKERGLNTFKAASHMHENATWR